ncbi:unnamed protein product [Effrenium voratum]|nr:unnamed protein product [Effrenium voratum]
MFDESLGLTVLAENDCDEYEDGQKQFLAQFVAAKPRCGGLPNTNQSELRLWKASRDNVAQHAANAQWDPLGEVSPCASTLALESCAVMRPVWPKATRALSHHGPAEMTPPE